MALSKIWIDLIPSSADEYIPSATKYKSDIGAYVTTGYIGVFNQLYTADMVDILNVLRSEITTPTTQPTPLFYFSENNTCAINIWRVLSNTVSSPPFGLSHIVCLVPIRFLKQRDGDTFAQIQVQETTIYLSAQKSINNILSNTIGIRPANTIDMPNSPVTKTATIPVNLNPNSNIGSFVISSTGIGLVKHIKSLNKYSIPINASLTRLVNTQALQQQDDITQITATTLFSGITGKRIPLLCESIMTSTTPTVYQNYTDPDTNYIPANVGTTTLFPTSAPAQRIFLVTHLAIDQQKNTLTLLNDKTTIFGAFFTYTNILGARTVIYPYLDGRALLLHGVFDTYLHTIQEGHWHRTTRYTSYKIKAQVGLVLYKRVENETPLEILGYSIYSANFSTYTVGIILNVNFGSTFAIPAAIQYVLQYEYEDGTTNSTTITTDSTEKNQAGYLLFNQARTSLTSALLSSYASSVDAANDGATNPLQCTPLPNFNVAGYIPIASNNKKIMRVSFYLSERVAKPTNPETNYEPNVLVVLAPTP